MTVINATGIDTKSWGSLPKKANLCYEITRVNTNRYKNKFEEYYLLRMWGDRRVTRLQIKEDEQVVYQFYTKKFSEAKEVALEVYRLLAEDSKYRNVYNFRQKIDVNFVENIQKSPSFDIVEKKWTDLYINNSLVTSIREIIKSYLEANLKGTGYLYTKREGFEGDIKQINNKEKYVLVDIDTQQVIFTVITPYSKQEFKMPKIELKEVLENNDKIEEYFLACEYVIAKIWEAKLAETVKKEKHVLY